MKTCSPTAPSRPTAAPRGRPVATTLVSALVATLAASSLALAQAPAPAPAAAPTAAVSSPVTPPVPAPPSVPTNGYILVDHDSGRVIAAQRPDDRMEPASITKLMTGYIVFTALREKRLTLTEEVPVSVNAWKTGGSASGGSTTFLEVNSRVPVEVLVKGMIVQSGNDATIALAERLGGTEDGFVQMMNEYAKRLGLTGTHFMNSWGGPHPDHYSTPRDLARLTSAIIRQFPEEYRWYSIREFTWNKHTQPNRNGLLYRDSSVDGVKTGHTESAQYCLVSSAKRSGMRLVSVVLGSPTIKAREDASAALLNYGFTFYETMKLHEAGKPLLKPRVYKGASETLDVGTTRDVYVTIPRGSGTSLSKDAKVNSPLIAPVAKNAPVGEYTVTAGGQVVSRVPLVALEGVEEGGFFHGLSDSVRLWME
jgi:serine-type D-Ala-D-Ala carboxypeptidase (penicillin-binding protein 5/6)